MKKMGVFPVVAVLMVFIFGCTSSNKPMSIAGVETEPVEFVPIDADLPAVHAYSGLYISGDTLIVHDHQSPEYQMIAYDIPSGRYLGAFGRTGNGPGEISNFANIMFDRATHKLYGVDGNRWVIVGFDMDEALRDSCYLPFVRVELDDSQGRMPFMNARYVNDSVALCGIYPRDDDGNMLSYHLGELSLSTGKFQVIDDCDGDPGARYEMAISDSCEMIVAVGRTHDCIKFFGKDGALVNTFKGADFKYRHDGRTYYYSSPLIIDDELYVVYNGRDAMKNRFGKEIRVIDNQGYVKRVLLSPVGIMNMVYHRSTGRLYVSTDGESQFGYLQL